jgi:hypothetical protein
MWIITKDGFISAVQNKTDPNIIRLRSRTRQHMLAACQMFDILDPDPEATIYEDQIIDYDEIAEWSDYRFHLDIPRFVWGEYLVTASQNIDYDSHVKESVCRVGTVNADTDLYEAMLDIWQTLYRLQSGVPRRRHTASAVEKLNAYIAFGVGQPVDNDMWEDDNYLNTSPSMKPRNPLSGITDAFDKSNSNRSIPRLADLKRGAKRPTAPNPFADAARAVAADIGEVESDIDALGPGDWERELRIVMDGSGTGRTGSTSMVTITINGNSDIDSDEFEDELMELMEAKGHDPELMLDWQWVDQS